MQGSWKSLDPFSLPRVSNIKVAMYMQLNLVCWSPYVDFHFFWRSHWSREAKTCKKRVCVSKTLTNTLCTQTHTINRNGGKIAGAYLPRLTQRFLHLCRSSWCDFHKNICFPPFHFPFDNSLEWYSIIQWNWIAFFKWIYSRFIQNFILRNHKSIQSVKLFKHNLICTQHNAL